jgi:hypothetical protein
MKRTVFTVTVILGLFLCASPINAALVDTTLLLPDITSDASGIYTYTAADGRVSFSATPITIYDGTNLVNIGGASRFYRADLYVDSSGNFVSGVPGDDLAIVGDIAGGPSGTLLTGEIIQFGFYDVPGQRALFDFVFEVTGGALQDDFGGLGKLGGDVIGAENTDFLANLDQADGGWLVNHSGTKVKHDTAPMIPPVPIPPAVFIFGSGLLALLALRRRFQS